MYVFIYIRHRHKHKYIYLKIFSKDIYLGLPDISRLNRKWGLRGLYTILKRPVFSYGGFTLLSKLTLVFSCFCDFIHNNGFSNKLK